MVALAKYTTPTVPVEHSITHTSGDSGALVGGHSCSWVGFRLLADSVVDTGGETPKIMSVPLSVSHLSQQTGGRDNVPHCQGTID